MAREKRKKYLKISHAVLHVKANANNTLLALSKENGDVLAQMSCGKMGFKNCRKSTPHATQIATAELLKSAVENFGVKTLIVRTNGPGIGRELVLMGIQKVPALTVLSIFDDTCLPYGGCTPARARRQ